ncbi:MAG: hypothetical protein ACYCQK_08830 [Acidiferrobacteraceae bacterium]
MSATLCVCTDFVTDTKHGVERVCTGITGDMTAVLELGFPRIDFATGRQLVDLLIEYRSDVCLSSTSDAG